MIAAVVPLKRLRDAKSRLSPSLSPSERSKLAIELLQGVLAALSDSGEIGRLAVVTPEPNLGSRFHVEVLQDAGDLTSSLQTGVCWALGLGAASLLIVPADLPLITPEDVRAIVLEAGDQPGITICATHDGGTGALLLTPPDAIPPAFGPWSFDRHLALAAERAFPVRILARSALESDLDTLDDLSLLRT